MLHCITQVGCFKRRENKIIGPWVFFAFISKSVNNQCDNPYIFGKIFSISTTSILRKRSKAKIYSRQLQLLCSIRTDYGSTRYTCVQAYTKFALSSECIRIEQ